MRYDHPQELQAVIQKWEAPTDAGAHAPTLRIQDIPSIFDFDVTGIEWAIEGFLPMSAVTMIAGDSGLLKSTLLTAAGRAIADGVDFIGMPTVKREVLILDRGENTLPIVRERYERLGITDGTGLRHSGSWLGDVPSPGAPAVVSYVTETVPRPVVFVDSLIAFLDGNENDSAVIRAFMTQCRQLANLGASVTILHHSGKAEKARQYRGSSDLKAVVDVAYSVTGHGDPTRLEHLTLQTFKSRIAVRPCFDLRFDGHAFSAFLQTTKPPAEEKNLRDLLVAHPRILIAEFEDLATGIGVARDRARTFLRQGVAAGKIDCQPGPRNSKLHTWVSTDDVG